MTRPLVLPNHDLQAEVYAALPVTEAIEVDLVAFRVYDRFGYMHPRSGTSSPPRWRAW